MMSERNTPPLAASERIFINVENGLIAVENGPSGGAAFNSVEVPEGIKDEFILETEDETNNTDALVKQACYQKEAVISEFNTYPTTVGNRLEPLERIFISVEDDFTATERDLLNENRSDPVAVLDDSTPETVIETNNVGNENQFFEITQCAAGEIKTEEIDSRPEDDPLAGCVLHYVNINCPAETNVTNESSVDRCESVECQIGFDCNVAPFMALTEYGEANDFCINEFDSKVSVFSSCYESDSIRSGSRLLDGQQLFGTYYDSSIQLFEVSVVLEDLFENVPRDQSGRPVQRHINSKHCPCVFCTGKFKLQPKKRRWQKNTLKPKHYSEKDSGNAANKKWNSCGLCPARFRFMHSLTRHSTTDHQVYLCAECPSKFWLRAELRTHLKLHPGNRPYYCVFCSFKSRSEAELKMHVRIHSSEKAFSCAECFAEFDKSQSLLDHVQAHMSGKFESRSNETVTKSALVEFKEKPGLSNCSNEAVISRSSDVQSNKKRRLSSQYHVVRLKKKGGIKLRLSRLQGINSHPRMYSCKMCPAEFHTTGGLTRHLATHSNGRPLSKVRGLEEGSVNQADPKPFQCKHCSAKFKGKGELKCHLAVHSGRRPYSCQICFLKFRNKVWLTRHLAVHSSADGPAYNTSSGKRKFQCEICPAAFEWKASLMRHAVVHSDDKPFVCAECDFKFKTKEVARRHFKRRHSMQRSNKRPYVYRLKKHSVNQPEKIALEKRSVDQPEKNALEERSVNQADPKPFQCKHCTAKFKGKGELKLHLAVHSGRWPYSCRICFLKFRNEGRLTCHLAVHASADGPAYNASSKKRRFQCEICPAAFKNKSTLMRHSVVHSDDRPFVCTECEAKFKTKEVARRHFEQQHSMRRLDKPPYVRRLKEYSVNQAEKIALEKRSVDQPEKNALEERSVNQADPKPFQRKHCTAKFKGKGELKRHLAVHSGRWPYSCQICFLKFRNEGRLTRHLAVHASADGPAYNTSSEKRKLQCEICPAAFKHKALLKRHSVVHSDDRPFVCTECEAKFKTKEVARRHFEQQHSMRRLDKPPYVRRLKEYSVNQAEKIGLQKCSADQPEKNALEECSVNQADLKPFKCKLCTAKFRVKGELKHHLAVHSGRWKYSCQICFWKFRNKALLTRHLAVHSSADGPAYNTSSEKRRFQCEICPAAFESKTHLMRHSVVHSDDRPFVCAECEAKFKTKVEVRRHLERHSVRCSDKQPYACKHCPSSFRLAQDRRCHITTYHRSENDTHLMCTLMESVIQPINGIFPCN